MDKLTEPGPSGYDDFIDDRLAECIEWIERHPDGKHYVACFLRSTAQDLGKRFPNATALPLSQLATGWSTTDENAYLCCTWTLRSSAVAAQLGGRLRGAKAREHTLIFTEEGKFHG
jgi:hypothetical protein